MPLISLIVPVYNTKNYLSRCLDSIRSQSFNDIEIILVDDGSTDGSSNLCDYYKSIDERIVVIHQNNAGVSRARNVGIEYSRSDWIMFVDSDDWLELNALELAYSQRREDVDLVVLNFFPSSCKVNVLSFYSLEDYRPFLIARCRIDNSKYFPKEIAHDLNLSSQCAKLYRTDVIKKYSVRFPEDIKNNEDGFFNIMFLLKARAVLHISTPIYHIFDRPDSASRTLNLLPARIVESVKRFNEMIDTIDSNKTLDTFRKKSLNNI